MGAGKKPEPIPWWCVGVSTVAFRQPHVEKSAKGGMGRIQGCGINGKARGGGGELSGKCGNIGEGLEERQKSF